MFNRENLLKGLLFIGYSVVMLYLIFSAKITKYVNPKMNYYLIIASVIFFAMGLNYLKNMLKRKHGTTSKSSKKYLVYFIPLITMVLLQPLSINSILTESKSFNMTNSQNNALMKSTDTIDEGNEVNSNKDQSKSNQSAKEANDNNSSDQESSNEEGNYIIYHEGQWVNIESLEEIIMTEKDYMHILEALFMEPQSLKGKSIEITGFVLRKDGFDDNQFVMGRGLITCCLADSAIVGVMATGDDFEQYKENQWLWVRGRLDVHDYNDNIIPIIIAEEVKTIPVPEQEYIYP